MATLAVRRSRSAEVVARTTEVATDAATEADVTEADSVDPTAGLNSAVISVVDGDGTGITAAVGAVVDGWADTLSWIASSSASRPRRSKRR